MKRNNDITINSLTDETILKGKPRDSLVVWIVGDKVFYVKMDSGMVCFYNEDGNWEDAMNFNQPIDKVRSIEDIQTIVDLQATIEITDSIIAQSEGVAGYHLNGNIATWNELGL